MLRAIGITRELKLAFGTWLFIFFATGMLYGLYLRTSAPAAQAVEFAEHNLAVQNEVGDVVRVRLDWIGHIHYEGGAGWASFQVHVSGKRTDGRIEVMLNNHGAGPWNVSGGRLVTDDGQVVEVVAPSDLVAKVRAMNAVAASSSTAHRATR